MILGVPADFDVKFARRTNVIARHHEIVRQTYPEDVAQGLDFFTTFRERQVLEFVDQPIDSRDSALVVSEDVLT